MAEPMDTEFSINPEPDATGSSSIPPDASHHNEEAAGEGHHIARCWVFAQDPPHRQHHMPPDDMVLITWKQSQGSNSMNKQLPSDVGDDAVDVGNDDLLETDVATSGPVKKGIRNEISEPTNISTELAREPVEKKKLKSDEKKKLKSDEKKKLDSDEKKNLDSDEKKKLDSDEKKKLDSDEMKKLDSDEMKKLDSDEKKKLETDKKKKLESDKKINLETVEKKKLELFGKEHVVWIKKKKNTESRQIYTCPECGDVTHRSNSFKKHLKTHPKIECDLCEFGTKNVNDAFFHSMKHREPTIETEITKPNNTPFPCVFCDNKKAIGKKDFNCNLCNISASSQAKRKYETATESINKSNLYGENKVVKLEHDRKQIAKMEQDEELEQLPKVKKVKIEPHDEEIAESEQFDEEMEQEYKVTVEIDLQNEQVDNMKRVKTEPDNEKNAKTEQFAESQIPHKVKIEEDEEIEQEDDVIFVIELQNEPTDKIEHFVELEPLAKLDENSNLEQEPKMDVKNNKTKIDLTKDAEFELPIWIEGSRNYCNTCDGGFRSKDGMIRHWWRHNVQITYNKRHYPFQDIEMLQCKMCGDKFTKRHFSRHIAGHDLFQKLECDQCEYKTLFKGHFNQHLKIHNK